MTKPRSQLICLNDTPYYHCISRCVRQARLCGFDPVTGKDYEYRKSWIERRLLFLAQIFAIDLCAYAVMSNHIHVVLRVNVKKSREWNTSEVLKQWSRLHHHTPQVRQYLKDSNISDHVRQIVEASAQTFRKRLQSISWFMKELNEPIARRANREEHCSGHFWDGRFKSQALLDESAVIACMAYVDLNPVRAGITKTPEESKYTSLHRRVKAGKTTSTRRALFPFMKPQQFNAINGLPIGFADYLELVDYTGRAIREDKVGAIFSKALPILDRLNITSTDWLTGISRGFSRNRICVAMEATALEHFCAYHHRKRRPPQAYKFAA